MERNFESHVENKWQHQKDKKCQLSFKSRHHGFRNTEVTLSDSWCNTLAWSTVSQSLCVKNAQESVKCDLYWSTLKGSLINPNLSQSLLGASSTSPYDYWKNDVNWIRSKDILRKLKRFTRKELSFSATSFSFTCWFGYALLPLKKFQVKQSHPTMGYLYNVAKKNQ